MTTDRFVKSKELYFLTMTIHSLTISKNLESRQLFKIPLFKEKIKRTKPDKHDGCFEVVYLLKTQVFSWLIVRNSKHQTQNDNLLSRI